MILQQVSWAFSLFGCFYHNSTTRIKCFQLVIHSLSNLKDLKFKAVKIPDLSLSELPTPGALDANQLMLAGLCAEAVNPTVDEEGTPLTASGTSGVSRS